LSLCPVALLVLLAAAAGTGVIAADFFAGPALRGLWRFTATLAAGHGELPLLLALELLLNRVDGRGRLPRRNRNLARRAVAHHLLRRRLGRAGYRRRFGNRAIWLRRGIHRLSIRADDLHPEEESHGVFLELRHHGLKEIEGLLLVGHQRILLRIAAQTNALFEVIHREQMVFPQAVDHAQHHHALVIAHRLRTKDLFLRLVAFFQPGKDLITQLMPAQLLWIDAGASEIQAEVVDEFVRKSLQVPLILADVLGGKLIENPTQDAADVVLQNQFPLLNAFKQLAAQAIDGLALLVHHVVVLEQMFTRLEVLRFNGLLRTFDSLRDHLRLDRDALIHTQPLQQGAHPLLREDAHQIVFEREIEARLAGIALASCAAAKLIVDTPRLVAFGAEDEQAARLDHAIMILLRAIGVPFVGLRPLGFRDLKLLALVVEAQKSGRGHGIDSAFGSADGARLAALYQLLAGHELGIAAEQNVGAAAGHVGGDRHHAQPASLRYDLRLALMELGIEHHVPHAFALQDAGKPLR